MSRDKQTEIEELAKAICGLGRDCHGCTASMSYICKAKKYAERAVDKGYAKASEVAREMCGMLREDLRGFVDGDYLERLLTTYEKKYTESEDEK